MELRWSAGDWSPSNSVDPRPVQWLRNRKLEIDCLGQRHRLDIIAIAEPRLGHCEWAFASVGLDAEKGGSIGWWAQPALCAHAVWAGDWGPSHPCHTQWGILHDNGEWILDIPTPRTGQKPLFPLLFQLFSLYQWVTEPNSLHLNFSPLNISHDPLSWWESHPPVVKNCILHTTCWWLLGNPNQFSPREHSQFFITHVWILSSQFVILSLIFLPA